MKSLMFALAVVASVAIHAQSDAYDRGALVKVKSLVPDRAPATVLPLRVVAGPNDRLSVVGLTLFVNDKPVTQFSSDMLARVAAARERIPPQVPEGHYFVMGEQRDNQSVSEYWGQHSAISLMPAR